MTCAEYADDGEVGIITLSHPPQNRLSAKLLEELAAAVDHAESSRARVLIFQSVGDHFSLGADVSEWPALSDVELRTLIVTINHLCQRVEALPIPTIAAVRGGCMGGGFELALHCDLIVAATDAEFRFPEATLAIPPLAGGVQRLADRIGPAVTTRLVFLTDSLSGTEAQQLGLVARTTAPSEVHTVAGALARQLADGPTLAYAATKGLLRGWSHGGVGVADRLLLELSAGALKSEDFARAVPIAADALKRKTPRPVLSFLGH